MTRRVGPFGVLILALAGCAGADSLPDDPDSMTIFSVDGTADQGGSLWKGPTAGAPMYKYPVLGSVEVTDPGRRREVMAAVRQGLRQNTPQAKCFWPRHIVRVRKGGDETDVVICFQCSNVEAHRAGNDTVLWRGTTGDGARPLLNEISAAAGVPITPTQRMRCGSGPRRKRALRSRPEPTVEPRPMRSPQQGGRLNRPSPLSMSRFRGH